MSKKYLMVFLLLLLMGWDMSLRAGMEEADQAKKRLALIWPDYTVLTSSPTLALRVTGGGFPLLGDSCSRSTGFLLHRAA
ncbi:hypothetical protein [Aeromonas caviae]|uniref:hypothetical protein n=1 Tax=Aeromonas caviae TaxID=648 RepID=UPI001FC7E4E4|nr:hypothetical protein [Aeromonas caviae]